MWGGVTLDVHRNTVTPLGLRDGENGAIKEILAKRAAELVRDGDTVLMDSSSTVRRIVKHLYGKRDVKIITNNARIFAECEDPSIELLCTGGYYDAEEHAFVGSAAERYVQGVNADIFFFSSSALSNEGEISDVSEVETALRRVMLTRARRRVFLCDSSKLGDRRTFVVCNKDDVTDIICDKKLPFESL